jgi:hypothetical protein
MASHHPNSKRQLAQPVPTEIQHRSQPASTNPAQAHRMLLPATYLLMLPMIHPFRL